MTIESAIKGVLEIAKWNRGKYEQTQEEDYENDAEFLLQVADLLKAQEPRVIALEELEDWDGAVFFEAFETDMYYALIETVEPTAGMDGAYVFVNVVPGDHHRRI